MQIKFKDNPSNLQSIVSIFILCDDIKLTKSLEKIDIESNNAVSNFISLDKSFKGKVGSTSTAIFSDGKGHLIVLVGGGDKKKISRKQLQSIGANIAVKLNAMKVEEGDIFIEDNILSENIQDIQTAAAYIAEGIKLRNYKFTKHYFNKKKDHELTLKSVSVFVNNAEQSSKIFERYSITADGVFLTRDLISEPGNIIYPESFAQKCLEMEKLGLKVKVLSKNDMAALGMGSLLGVAQGSANEAKLVAIELWGDVRGKEIPPLALVGKGVTFDTGGINLKSSAHITEMKYDMGGAGVVAGLMQSLAEQKVEKNIIGFLGLVENMPSGTAQRPSDVVISMSGQTIEIDNTDAEGRLVLADVMWYAQTEYNCQTIIDLATLTGAIGVALGDEFAGLFSNNDELSEQLINSGKEVNELLWRMPLSEHYDSRINSDIADIRNTGKLSGAGATTAAQFLQRFLKDKNRRWAHLDIAGVTWTSNGELTNGLKGATGFGVRLLENYIHSYYKP